MRKHAPAALALAAALLLAGCAQEQPSASSQIFAMDTVMSLEVYGDGAEERAAQAAETIYRLEDLWDVTDEDSEIWALDHSGGAWVDLSPETAELLDQALALCALARHGLMWGAQAFLPQLWEIPAVYYAAVMLASLAMFIWSPAPQYILVAIPIFAAYAAVYRPGLIRPLVFFTVAYVLLTFGYGNLIYVYTLAADLGWISLDSLYSAAEFLATPVFGTYLDDLLCTITDVTAEISLIYLAYRWYTESKSPLQGDLHGVPVFV